MLRRLNANIIIALWASCGIVAFAFYERYRASEKAPAAVFYVAAAVISLLPVLSALWRHRNCNK